MIQSMTGYGKAAAAYKDKKISVEVKSLNSKSLDLSTHIAPLYREKEMELRRRITGQLQRGKVDLVIHVERDARHAAAVINVDLIKAYMEQLQALGTDSMPAGSQAIIAALLRLPDVVEPAAEDDTLGDEEWAVVSEAVDRAIEQLTAFRSQEGAALEVKMLEKADNIERLLHELEPYEQSRVDKIRRRITEALKTIPEVDYDKNRLEQELIYYIEKLDISEEKQRLANHLDYFRRTLAEATGQGKKLGFIAQEMGREINTTGSKSNNAEMQSIVVRMKDELEQIKEQVLNIL